jgi:hypothetical protein
MGGMKGRTFLYGLAREKREALGSGWWSRYGTVKLQLAQGFKGNGQAKAKRIMTAFWGTFFTRNKTSCTVYAKQFLRTIWWQRD